MKVLVTGGAGFIGSNTVDALLKKGYEVRVLDSLQERVHPNGKPEYLTSDVEFIHGDVSDPDVMLRALRGVERVFHLAAYQDYMPDFSRFVHTNAESTALIYELIVAHSLPVEKVVIASSQAVYGDGKYRCPEHGIVFPGSRPLAQLERGDWEVRCEQCDRALEPQWIDESRVNPFTAYGITKYTMEMLAFNLGRRYDIPAAAMRYTYVVGPRNSFYNAYSGATRIFTLRLLSGRAPVVYEDGMQLRDYVYVGDVAAANVTAMESDEANYRAFNVGGGRAYTVLELYDLVARAVGSDIRAEVPGQFRYGDTRHTFSDISDMKSLGWEPSTTVEQAVRTYVDWVRQQPEARDTYEQAEQAMRQAQVLRSASTD